MRRASDKGFPGKCRGLFDSPESFQASRVTKPGGRFCRSGYVFKLCDVGRVDKLRAKKLEKRRHCLWGFEMVLQAISQPRVRSLGASFRSIQLHGLLIDSQALAVQSFCCSRSLLLFVFRGVRANHFGGPSDGPDKGKRDFLHDLRVIPGKNSPVWSSLLTPRLGSRRLKASAWWPTEKWNYRTLSRLSARN